MVQLPFGQSKLEGLLSSHPRQRKGKQRGRARERVRGRRSVTQMGSQGWTSLAWVAIWQIMPNWLARHPRAKWWAPQQAREVYLVQRYDFQTR
jgi:hypothetical protein